MIGLRCSCFHFLDSLNRDLSRGLLGVFCCGSGLKFLYLYIVIMKKMKNDLGFLLLSSKMGRTTQKLGQEGDILLRFTFLYTKNKLVCLMISIFFSRTALDSVFAGSSVSTGTSAEVSLVSLGSAVAAT
jgi:hypothetical protein